MINAEDKLQILKSCLAQCETRLKYNSQKQPLLIIKEVVEELISIVQGKLEAPANMEENNKIGLFAVREFEPHDMEFANSIYKVVEVNNELRNT
jgi:hypothetical protein